MSGTDELSELYLSIQRARMFADEMHRYGIKKSGTQTHFMHALMEDVEDRYERLYSVIRPRVVNNVQINKTSAPSIPAKCEDL